MGINFIIKMITLRTFEAFAGYGSQLMALRRLEQNYPDKIKVEPIGISEIDQYAIKAYKAVHGDVKNYGDICNIDWNEVPDFDLFTYSFPCTDISMAGRMKGLTKGSGTRSSLLWECEKAIEIKRPKYLLMENVAALVLNKFIKHFHKWQYILEGYGYKSFAKVLNSKCYGVPQNRDRIFLVSIREDVDLHFYFPNPFKLKKRLVDVLEDDVDEKYYISDTALNGYVEHNKRHIDKGTGFLFQPKDIEEDGGGIANTIRANGAVCPTDNHIIVKSNKNANMKLIGKITLGKEAMISDPRYSSAYSEDNNYLCKNVEDGEFECYVDEDVHLDRVKRIVVKKSDADVKDVDMHRVGVDSAMIGIFDYEYFKKSRVNYGIRPDAWLERCFRLFQDQDSFIIDEQGFVSISGFGDGEYDLMVGENKGKAVYFEITFIKDE
jgi:DNA (cytosine-5)-methyltransferase 1